MLNFGNVSVKIPVEPNANSLDNIKDVDKVNEIAYPANDSMQKLENNQTFKTVFNSFENSTHSLSHTFDQKHINSVPSTTFSKGIKKTV